MSNLRSRGDNSTPLWCHALHGVKALAGFCQGSGIPGIAQAGSKSLKMLEILQKPQDPTTLIAPRLFFTHDNGPNAVKLTQLELMTSDDYLRDAGASVLFAYNDVLMMLGGDRVGDLRLQNGLAAAVAGLSATKFFDLPEEMKDSHRRRFVRIPIHQQLAPHLIIYLGTPAPNQNRPATSGRIQFHNKDVQEMEFYPWDSIRGTKDVSATAWGWITRSLDPQAHFIFLSAIFVAWPTGWFQESPVNFASYKSTLLLHLKITLYHELAHYLRNLAHGVCDNNTAEKCVDHPSKTRQHGRDNSRSVGEAGRQAEAMAFGAVIDIALSPNGTPELLVSNLDQQGAPTYSIPPKLTDLLFNGIQPSAPLDLVAISATQAPSNASGSGSINIVGKESLASLATPHSKGKAKADFIRPSTPNHSQATTLIPVTGESLERIKALQPRLDVLKGSCMAPDMVEH